MRRIVDQDGIDVALMGVGRDCYTAAKGGIAAITRSTAVEFADLDP
jgi:NAD(P)-dependent dehydrogenase (short-subunit alcohol dehydrogenase family)